MSAYTARATGDPRAQAHPVPEAGTAVEAALLFVEKWLPDADDGSVSVIVTEGETGCEHCFRIDLDEGSAAPC
jgi:hypothetical protein